MHTNLSVGTLISIVSPVMISAIKLYRNNLMYLYQLNGNSLPAITMQFIIKQYRRRYLLPLEANKSI